MKVACPDQKTRPANWQLEGHIQAIPGYLFGSQHPSLIIRLSGQKLAPRHHRALVDWVRQKAANPKGVTWVAAAMPHGNDFKSALECLFLVLQQVQLDSGLLVFEHGRVLTTTSETACCIIPTTRRALPTLPAVVEGAVDLLRACSDSESASPDMDAFASSAEQALKEKGSSSSSMFRFAQSALTLGIPVREMPARIHLFGLGSRGRWLEGSFTDATPNLAARLARNKHEAGSVLRMAGLPVPSHGLARSVQEASALARRLGYPVVVKPADLDGGIGVAADLACAEEVAEAFAAARRKSRNILVEKHVEGRDYRLTVFQNQLIWAVERIPAGITGDGRSSVQQLIERENANPLRSGRTGAPLKPLKADRAALNLLRSQNLDLASVVPEGKFVRLCRAANIASGGTPIAVFEHVHPDNALLAVRAARALKLDIAGIDLIIPDIAVSWKTNGAAICEVNGQPNIGQMTALHLYAPMLRGLIEGNGRIPVIVVITPDENSTLAHAIAAALGARGMRAGYHDASGVHLDGQTLAPSRRTPFDAGQILALESTTDAILLTINDDGVLRTGLPVARIDLLIDAAATTAGAGLGRTFDALLAACEGRTLHIPEQTPATSAPFVTEIVEATLEIDRKHRDANIPVAPTPQIRSQTSTTSHEQF